MFVMNKLSRLAVEHGYRLPDPCEVEGIKIYHKGDTLLDPLFWQAIGRGLGWYETLVVLELDEKQVSCVGREPFTRHASTAKYTKKTPNKWKTKMRGYVDYIIKGGDGDEYLISLFP